MSVQNVVERMPVAKNLAIETINPEVSGGVTGLGMFGSSLTNVTQVRYGSPVTPANRYRHHISQVNAVFIMTEGFAVVTKASSVVRSV
jgi:hypothetical protein